MTDPYQIEAPALVAFSGGRTSAFMLWNILQAHGGSLPEGVVVTFCNTGLEHEETLKFVERCSIEWGVEVVWLEYLAGSPCDQYPTPSDSLANMLREKAGRKTLFHTFIIVDYVTASRKGEPMSSSIESKRMLPNPVSRFCTADTKIRTMQRYAKSLGWTQWETVIGLRYDEPHRVHRQSKDNQAEVRSHPMYYAKHTLADVDEFWGRQSFKLGIPQHMGNCVGFFLKSRSKIDAVAREAPEYLEWWVEQERRIREWGTATTAKAFRFRKDRPGYETILKQVAEQPLFFTDHDYDTMPCNCTD